jgi:hypothetical protein
MKRFTWKVTDNAVELLYGDEYTVKNLRRARSAGVSYEDAMLYLVDVRNVPDSIAKQCIVRVP